MQLTPFQDDSPNILPLDTDFWVPDGFSFTGCRWNHYDRKRGRDKDGQVKHSYVKKFALEGHVESYRYGTVAAYPRDMDCQAGLICSPHTYLMVVECDTPEEWDDAILGGATPTVRSRRGFHFYFFVAPEFTDLVPTDGPIPGGDVQTKGFVPAPGTEHPAGVMYQLVSDRINVADAALLHRLREAREVRRQQELEAYRAAGGSGGWSGDGGVHGQDDYLAKVVTWNAVARGLTEEQVREEWNREASALPQTPGDPFTEDDFRRHYQGAAQEWAERKSHGDERVSISDDIQSWADSLGGAGGGGGDDDSAPPALSDDDEPSTFLPPGYRKPPTFGLTPDGVVQIVTVGKQTDEVQVTHRPLYVSGIEVDSDDVSWYELTWMTHDKSNRKIVIPSGSIADRTQLMRAFPEVVVTTKGATAAAEYLTSLRTVNAKWLAAEGRTRRVALRLGWYGEDEQSGFAAGPGRPYQVRDVSNLGGWLQGHRSRGRLDDWAAIMNRMPVKVIMLAAASLSAPLLKLLEAPGFVVDNSGGTTQGKTRALRVAASAWGDPDRILLSWSATKAALELHAQKSHGIPLLIDDSKLAKDKDQIAGLVYQITSGMATGRLERSADRLRGGDDIQTVVLTNGETPLLTAGRGGRRDGGAVARVLELWGGAFPTAEEADSVTVAIRENHGLAGEAFVRAAIGIGAGELRSRYSDLKLRARSMTKTDVARRRADAAAVVMLAAQVGHEAGLLPSIPELAWTSLLEDDAAEEGSDDRALAALEMLWTKVALDPRLFWAPENGFGDGLLDSVLGIAGGWAGRVDTKAGWVAVSPEWLRKFLSDEGEDAEGLIRQWGDRGWTERSDKGRRTTNVRINAKLVRVYKITHGGDFSREASSSGEAHA